MSDPSTSYNQYSFSNIIITDTVDENGGIIRTITAVPPPEPVFGGHYSITFISSSNVSKNTWQDWYLTPVTPPQVVPPEPYTNYVEIPGRVEGPIDLSEALTGAPSFLNSEGSWQFVSIDNVIPRVQLWPILKTFLHGRQLKIIFEEDPNHYYIGRLSLDEVTTGQAPNVYTINYTIRPVRYNLDGTRDGV